MTQTLAARFAMTDDELLVAASRVGVQSLPVVLALRPRHQTETALVEAVDRATRALTERGLLHNGELTPGLANLLRALQRPDCELAMRLVTPDGIARMSIVRRGTQAVSALRIGNDVTLEAVDGDAGLAAVSRALLLALPISAAAEIIAVGAPLDAACQALADTHDAAELSDRVRSLGAEPRAAMLLGSALGARLAFAEVVYYALDPETDLVARCPAAVGVFYTKRGRIVAAPSASPSGQLWTTLKPGSDHAIRQAIGQLVELSANRWEEF